MTDATTTPPRKPRRPNGKADRAARRAKWDAEVHQLAELRYGVDLRLSPTAPDLLRGCYRMGWGVAQTVDHVGARFDLVELETYKLATGQHPRQEDAS